MKDMNDFDVGGNRYIEYQVVAETLDGTNSQSLKSLIGGLVEMTQSWKFSICLNVSSVASMNRSAEARLLWPVYSAILII